MITTDLAIVCPLIHVNVGQVDTSLSFWSMLSLLVALVIIVLSGWVLVVRNQKILAIRKKMEMRFEALIENGSDCVIIISPPNGLTYVSRSIKNVLGYTPEEVMKMDMISLIHPDDAEGSQNAIATSINHPGVPIQGHVSRVKHKDGSWRWMDAIVTNLIDDPAVGGIVDNFRDVTDRIKAEDELQQIAQRLLLAVQASNLGIWDLDIPNGTLIWDPEMFHIYNTVPESFTGRLSHWLDMIHPDDRETVAQKLHASTENGVDFNAEFRIHSNEPPFKHVKALAAVQRNSSGQAIRLVGTHLDVTNNKEYEKTLEQILYDISHKIRRPVTNILGLTAMLGFDQLDEKIIRECARHLKSAAKELDDFTVSLNDTYFEKKVSISGGSPDELN